MDKSLTSISKFLSYVLRHRPDAIGITLDEHGWASVDEIIAKSKDPITWEQIVEVVSSNDKKRFSLDVENRRIRANQGHSVDVDVQLKAAVPPPVLYHGTAYKFLGAIVKEGLKPMSRQHVHLSADKETAQNVGSRRGQAEILKIDAHAMTRDGHQFYLSENGVWLVDSVPVKYIINIDQLI